MMESQASRMLYVRTMIQCLFRRAWFSRAMLVATWVVAGPSISSQTEPLERTVEQGFNSWYASTFIAKVSPEVDVVGQYHFRRTDVGSDWQQSLLFLGAEWHRPSSLAWSAAYANIVNFPGGEAKQEHRLFEQLVYSFPAGKWSIGHRHRVEHRWLEEKDFAARHRYRIDFSASRALNESGTWTVRAHNESLIALFDRTTNVFYQQNWLGLGVVHRFSPSSALSLEYMNQFIVSGGGWNATSNHTLNWMYIQRLDLSKSSER